MPTQTLAPSRGRSVAAWAGQGLLAAAFLFFGGTKLAGRAEITYIRITT